MIKPFSIGVVQEDTSSKGFMPDFTKSIDAPLFEEEKPSDNKRKRGRPSKKDQGDLFSSPAHMTQGGSEFIAVDDKDGKSRELSIMESNEPFEKKYAETNNILRSAIMQLDSSMSQVQEDINYVRNSKTMRNKYQYLQSLYYTFSVVRQTIIAPITDKTALTRRTCSTPMASKRIPPQKLANTPDKVIAVVTKD